jgi:hypothetical protein
MRVPLLVSVGDRAAGQKLVEEEVTRLGILISELPHSPPLPRYTVDLMPTGLSEEDAFNLALQALVPPPPTYPWAAPAFSSPPPSTYPWAVSAFAPTVLDWASAITDLVDLT